jgi:hypothetical protein
MYYLAVSFNFEGNSFDLPPRDSSSGPRIPRTVKDFVESTNWILGASVLAAGIAALIHWYLAWLVGLALLLTTQLLRRRYKAQSRWGTTSNTDPADKPLRMREPASSDAPAWKSSPFFQRNDTFRRGRDLYLTILSALIGFNIFRSLFGRENTFNSECGSWFFPVLDETGAPIGFFTSGADRACPRLISGNFTEALVSAVILGLLTALQFFRTQDR